MSVWEENETSSNTINDKRLNKRMEKLLTTFCQKPESSNQYLLHPSIAFTPSRVNLGVLSAKFWQRPEDKVSHLCDKKPIEEKGSYR